MTVHICHVNLASGFSGGERQTLEMIKQQLKLGIRLTVVANPRSLFFKEIALLNCTLIAAKKFWNAQLRSKNDRFDLVHVHEGRAVHWAYIQNRIYGTPYIITRRIDNPLKRKSLRQYKKASTLVGLSSIICDRLKEASPDSQIEKIPSSPVSYPIDPKAVREIKDKFPGKFLVIQAANMYEHKGFDVSIRAAEILSRSQPEVQFVFLGDGRLRETLEEQAKLLPNIHFAGKQSNMGDWFASADLMVHPSYSEGLGSVILEAMNSDLPVIATRAGGIPDIIENGVNGILVEPGDEKALADNITLLFNKRETRENIINCIKPSLKEFRIEFTSKKYVELYERITWIE